MEIDLREDQGEALRKALEKDRERSKEIEKGSCLHPKKLFNDPDWENFIAPVVPPSWVVALLRELQEPVNWHNTGQYGLKSCCRWSMAYLTKFSEDGKIITHLMPGSVQPKEGWLRAKTPPSSRS